MVARIVDVVVPEIFTPYVQQLTTELSELVRAGVLVPDAFLSGLLTGGGRTFNIPQWRDLDNVDENISSDDPASKSTPQGTGSETEIAVRLSRNQSWSGMDLAAELAGDDPMRSIASRVAYYWTRRVQAAWISTVQGVFADNDKLTPNGYGSTGDLTNDISGAYQPGVTDFSAEAFIDTQATMGDAAKSLGVVMMHSVVFARAKKNNLIDFVPDSTNPDAADIPTFLGTRVVEDDGMPNPAGAGAAQTPAGVFHTWLMATGSGRLGQASPKVPTETERSPDAGDGGGQDTLYNRVTWGVHPNGHAFIGNPTAEGGPSNAATLGNLAHEDSWKRIMPERKQVRIARLITTEL